MMADTVQVQEWIDYQTTAGWPVCILSYLRERPSHVRLQGGAGSDIPPGNDWQSVANYLTMMPVVERAALKGPTCSDLFVRLLGEVVGNAFAEHFRDGLDKVLADFDDIVQARHQPATVTMLNEPYEVLLSQSRGPTDLMNRVASQITNVPRVSAIFEGTAAVPDKPFTAPVAYSLVAILAMEANRTRAALYDLFQREKLWIHGRGSKAPLSQANTANFAHWDLFGYYFDGVNRATDYVADAMPPEFSVLAIRMMDRRGFAERVKG